MLVLHFRPISQDYNQVIQNNLVLFVPAHYSLNSPLEVQRAGLHTDEVEWGKHHKFVSVLAKSKRVFTFQAISADMALIGDEARSSCPFLATTRVLNNTHIPNPQISRILWLKLYCT